MKNNHQFLKMDILDHFDYVRTMLDHFQENQENQEKKKYIERLIIRICFLVNSFHN